jgi:hypothetical protein
MTTAHEVGAVEHGAEGGVAEHEIVVARVRRALEVVLELDDGTRLGRAALDSGRTGRSG